jgi:hypothetical protein
MDDATGDGEGAAWIVGVSRAVDSAGAGGSGAGRSWVGCIRCRLPDATQQLARRARLASAPSIRSLHPGANSGWDRELTCEGALEEQPAVDAAAQPSDSQAGAASRSGISSQRQRSDDDDDDDDDDDAAPS